MKRYEKKSAQPLIDKFCAVTNLTDIARLLKLSPHKLAYILYTLEGSREAQYKEFEIQKRSGGTRKISAPTTALKEVQARLNDTLQAVYWEKPSVHSFIKKRSAKTNALGHCNRKFVFNIDLKDFFPSINFGRVRGLFMSAPYSLPEKAATILAQIACHNNELPQGAPSSPIISNLICSKLDSELIALAKKYKCFYSRYADDITFSTNLKIFPIAVGRQGISKAIVGPELARVIKANGFEINNKKVKLQLRVERQEVTGLVVNEFVNVRRKYIRQTRAMIHAWKKFGLVEAEREYYEKYCETLTSQKDFAAVLRGKIEFISSIRDNKRKRQIHRIKGYSKEDISTKFLRQFFDLVVTESEQPILCTEGPTDWMHLINAWEHYKGARQFAGMELNFFKSKHEMCCGEANLLKFCNTAKKLIRKPKSKIICIFDNDVPNVNKVHNTGPFRYWGNKVYSFILPNPSGYTGRKTFSIEMFYGDKFITNTYDSQKRRLYFSDEFDSSSLKHKKNSKIVYGVYPKTGKKINNAKATVGGNKKIIDSYVVQKSMQRYFSMALSKKHFAINILKKEGDFGKANLKEFIKIFKVVKNVIAHKP